MPDSLQLYRQADAELARLSGIDAANPAQLQSDLDLLLRIVAHLRAIAVAIRPTNGEITAGASSPAGTIRAYAVEDVAAIAGTHGGGGGGGALSLITQAAAEAGTETTARSVSAQRMKQAFDAYLTAWLGAAPGALNTLDELAAALGDDPNFAATVTAALAGKLNASAVSAFILTLLDDADAPTARQTLGIAIEPLGYTTAAGQPDIKLDNIFDDTKYSQYHITGWALPATNNVTFVPTLRNATPADVSGGIVAGGVMTRIDSNSATFDNAQTSIAGSVSNASHGGVTFEMILTLASGRNHPFFVRTQATQNGTSGAGNAVQARHYSGWFVDTTLRQGIKFAFSSGNIASGWLNIEGIRK